MELRSLLLASLTVLGAFVLLGCLDMFSLALVSLLVGAPIPPILIPGAAVGGIAFLLLVGHMIYLVAEK